jgi:hypothetical protein
MGREMRYKALSVYIWIVSSIMLVSACSGVDTPDFPAAEDYPISFTTSPQSQTKISLSGTSVGWENSDILQITAVDADKKSAVSDLSVYSIDQTNDNIASFSGYVTMQSKPEVCYFTYPAGNPMTVNTSTGKIVARYNEQDGTHKPFMYSKVSYDERGMSSDLTYAGAMLEVEVLMEDVCSLAFFGNKFENIFPLYIDPESGAISKSDELGYMIQVPVQSEGKTYICVPPVELKHGFSLVMIKADGDQMVKSFSDGSTGGYDFSEKAGYLIPIKLAGEWEDFGISYGSLEFGHVKVDNLLAGTQISYKMEATGLPVSRIENWGATLYNEKHVLVRNYKSSDGEFYDGGVITLDVVGDYKLLPAGDYTFTPYCTAFGETTSFESRTIKIEDPGVEITLGGYTSYDKYKDGKTSEANNCASNIIHDLSASVNVHPSILDSYSAVLDGNDITSTATGTGLSSVSFGNVTKNSLKSYPYKVTVKVGNLTFEESRVFHITGLPMEVNFKSEKPAGWGYLGHAEYNTSEKSVVFKYSSLGWEAWQSAITSPSFYLPGEINVGTSADAASQSDIYLYVKPCESNANTMEQGSAKIDMNKDNKSANKYYEADQSIKLSGNDKSIMYCTTTLTWKYQRVFIYRIKIYYK